MIIDVQAIVNGLRTWLMDFIDPRLTNIERMLTRVLDHIDNVNLAHRVSDLEEARSSSGGGEEKVTGPAEFGSPAYFDRDYYANPYHVSVRACFLPLGDKCAREKLRVSGSVSVLFTSRR